MNAAAVLDWVLARCNVEDRGHCSPCWVWAGAKTPNGYAVGTTPRALTGKRGARIHRLTYEVTKGAIPDGYQTDHLCRVRACVNPDHLEAVTPKENSRRTAKCFRGRTHCNRGHQLNEANVYHHPKGTDHCRPCRQLAVLRYRHRKRNGLALDGLAAAAGLSSPCPVVAGGVL